MKLSALTDTFFELILIYLAIVIIAALGFSYFEHKAFVDSLWWTSVTAMTVGYGDIYPLTLGGRIVAVILMHIVPLGIVPLFIARYLGKIVEDKNAFKHEEQEDIKRGIKQIQGHLGIKDDYEIKE